MRIIKSFSEEHLNNIPSYSLNIEYFTGEATPRNTTTREFFCPNGHSFQVVSVKGLFIGPMFECETCETIAADYPLDMHPDDIARELEGLTRRESNWIF